MNPLRVSVSVSGPVLTADDRRGPWVPPTLSFTGGLGEATGEGAGLLPSGECCRGGVDGALPELRAHESRLVGGGLHRAEGVSQPTWPLRDGGIFSLEPGGGGRPVGMGAPEAVLCGHGGHALVPWTRSSGLG